MSGGAGQKWRQRYGYVLPYALQGPKFVVHALDPDGSYFPPPCGKTNVQLVLRENLAADRGKPCGKCAALLAARGAARG